MSEERFKDIETTIKDLSKKVSHLDKSFVEVSISLRDYVGWTKQLELTLRNFDESMKELSKHNQRIPFERMQDIKEWLHPVHEKLDELEISKVARRDLHTLVFIIIFFISGITVLLGTISSYIIDDVKKDIITSVAINKDLINKNAAYIEVHDKSRIEILGSLHTHKNINENGNRK